MDRHMTLGTSRHARTHRRIHSRTVLVKTKDGNSSVILFFCYLHKAKAMGILVCTVHPQKLSQNFNFMLKY